MRELLGVSDSTVSSLELKCVPGASLAGIKDQVRTLLGADFVIKDAYEQNEAFFKVMRLEKWMGFAFTLLMLVLMAFNTIGAMWMIVLDKQQDIAILKTMGATDRMIYRIFMLEGILLTFLGLIIGFILAVVIYIIQKEYGIITIPEGFLVTSYPISMRFQDFFPVVFAVMSIGILASIAPALRAVRVPTYFRAA
jgi:lipoprotein-releasing system permease protein